MPHSSVDRSGGSYREGDLPSTCSVQAAPQWTEASAWMSKSCSPCKCGFRWCCRFLASIDRTSLVGSAFASRKCSHCATLRLSLSHRENPWNRFGRRSRSSSCEILLAKVTSFRQLIQIAKVSFGHRLLRGSGGIASTPCVMAIRPWCSVLMDNFANDTGRDAAAPVFHS